MEDVRIVVANHATHAAFASISSPIVSIVHAQDRGIPLTKGSIV